MDFFALLRKKLNNEIQWNGPDPLEWLDPVHGVRSAIKKNHSNGMSKSIIIHWNESKNSSPNALSSESLKLDVLITGNYRLLIKLRIEEIIFMYS